MNNNLVDGRGRGRVAEGVDGVPMPPAAHLACSRRCLVQRALVRVCRRPALLEATHAMTDVHVHPDAQVYMLWGGNGWIGGLLIEYAHAHSYVIKLSSARYAYAKMFPPDR